MQFNLLELPSARNAISTFGLPAFATFEKQQLGTCLNNFAEAYRVPIWIDRRVDISRIITMVGQGEKDSASSKTILGRMQALAKLGGADAGLIENVVYVGRPKRLSMFSAPRCDCMIKSWHSGRCRAAT